MSLLDGQVAWMTYMATTYFATGEPPGRMGSKHPTIAPYQAFPTEDDYVVVAVSLENMWLRFCCAIDRADLIDDERFATNADRVENRAELDALLEAEISQYTTEEVIALLEEHGVPASAVLHMADMFAREQVQARGMHRSVTHPTAGEVEMPGSPMQFSRTPTTIRRHPPLLGEHTEEVLSELGYSDETIRELRENDVM